MKDADALISQGTPKAQVYAKLTANGLTKAAAPAPQQQQPQAPAARQAVTLSKSDSCKGADTAKVTIIEYSDFQCPFCSRVVPTAKQILDTWPKDVKFCFRNNPLPFHKDAPLASEAALAAGDQGKFWPMHDKLFENQKDLSRAALERYGVTAADFSRAVAREVRGPVGRQLLEIGGGTLEYESPRKVFLNFRNRV